MALSLPQVAGNGQFSSEKQRCHLHKQSLEIRVVEHVPVTLQYKQLKAAQLLQLPLNLAQASTSTTSVRLLTILTSAWVYNVPKLQLVALAGL